MDDQYIKNLVGKRIRAYVDSLIIEGLLAYYGQPKYTGSINYLPKDVKEYLDHGNQLHLFNLKFYYKDGREIQKNNKGVGYYVLKTDEFKSLEIYPVE